jgi:HPt (histidine-containing phosphotransfer) domain-containing protein
VDELAEAIEQGDDDRCRSLAHALKGSSATMGAHRLQQLCDSLCHPTAADASGPAAERLSELREVSAQSLDAVAEALA